MPPSILCDMAGCMSHAVLKESARGPIATVDVRACVSEREGGRKGNEGIKTASWTAH